MKPINHKEKSFIIKFDTSVSLKKLAKLRELRRKVERRSVQDALRNWGLKIDKSIKEG